MSVKLLCVKLFIQIKLFDNLKVEKGNKLLARRMGQTRRIGQMLLTQMDHHLLSTLGHQLLATNMPTSVVTRPPVTSLNIVSNTPDASNNVPVTINIVNVTRTVTKNVTKKL